MRAREHVFGVKVPDIHVPAHDPRYVDGVCAWMKRRHIDFFDTLGDTFDFESISRFVAESPGKIAKGDVLEEIKIGQAVLEQFVDAARHQNKSCVVHILEGNHEKRLKSFGDRNPQIASMLDIERLLDFKKLRATWVPNDSTGKVLRQEWFGPHDVRAVVLDPAVIYELVRWGVTSCHGWRHSMHAAKASIELSPWPGPLFFGHTHRAAIFTADSWGMFRKWGATIGWGGRPWPDWIGGRPNGWCQAIGVWSMNTRAPGLIDGMFLRVVDGEVVMGEVAELSATGKAKNYG